MAITETYLNLDLATGLNDGTSEANAWQTWAAATVTGGSRLNVKNSASRATESITKTIAANGGSNTPWHIRGYGSTIGDGVLARFQDVALNVTGKNGLVESLDLLGTTTTTPIVASGWNSGIYNCKVETNGSTSGACISVSQGGSIVNCSFVVDIAGIGTAAGQAVDISNGVAYGNIIRVVSELGTMTTWSALRLQCPTEHAVAAIRNLIYVDRSVNVAPIRGIYCLGQSSSGDYGGYAVMNNTIDNVHTGIYNATAGGTTIRGTSVFANNLITGCPLAIEASQAGAQVQWGALFIRNAIDGNMSGCVPVETVRITEDPYTDGDNQDFSLNSAAGGGGSCRAAAADRNGTLDIGAIGA